MAERPEMEANKVRTESTYPAGGPREGSIDRSRPRGKLKIFLSYAPGVGKTLAMLEDAYRRLRDGDEVLSGFVDANGDPLSLHLLENFEAFPQRAVTASGISYQGMDLDGILARRPQLVLVDHLARVNPPGLRHVARYLEVDELLNSRHRCLFNAKYLPGGKPGRRGSFIDRGHGT